MAEDDEEGTGEQKNQELVEKNCQIDSTKNPADKEKEPPIQIPTILFSTMKQDPHNADPMQKALSGNTCANPPPLFTTNPKVVAAEPQPKTTTNQYKGVKFQVENMQQKETPQLP